MVFYLCFPYSLIQCGSSFGVLEHVKAKPEGKRRGLAFECKGTKGKVGARLCKDAANFRKTAFPSTPTNSLFKKIHSPFYFQHHILCNWCLKTPTEIHIPGTILNSLPPRTSHPSCPLSVLASFSSSLHTWNRQANSSLCTSQGESCQSQTVHRVACV